MRFALLAITLCLGLTGVAGAAEPEVYIFDVLALQPYRGNLAKLVKPKETPDWVKSIVTQGEGLAVPMKTIDIGGTPYRLDHVCKVGDCKDNTLDVLWAPRGAKVWAALVVSGKPPVMLGQPPAAQAKALEAAMAAPLPAVSPAPTSAAPAPTTAAPAAAAVPPTTTPAPVQVAPK